MEWSDACASLKINIRCCKILGVVINTTSHLSWYRLHILLLKSSMANSLIPGFQSSVLISVVSTWVRLPWRPFLLFLTASISSAFLSISIKRLPSFWVLSILDRFSLASSFVAFFRPVLQWSLPSSSSVIQEELAEAELSVLESIQQNIPTWVKNIFFTKKPIRFVSARPWKTTVGRKLLKL